MKKLMIMMIGRKEKANKLVRGLIFSVVVAMAYAPAPIKPAPPVPLPHEASAKWP